MATEGKRFLVVVGVSKLAPARVMEVGAGLRAALTRLCVPPLEQPLRAVDVSLIVYAIRSTRSANEICSELDGPTGAAPFLTNADSVLVVELGAEFSGRGFSRFWTWLQRH